MDMENALKVRPAARLWNEVVGPGTHMHREPPISWQKVQAFCRKGVLQAAGVEVWKDPDADNSAWRIDRVSLLLYIRQAALDIIDRVDAELGEREP